MVDPQPPRRPEPAAPPYIWRPQPEFGPWLRDMRLKRGLSIRALAAQTGLSFSQLQRLEASGRLRAPTLDLIEGLALFYGLAVEEVLEKAGFKVDLPPDLKDVARCEQSFQALVQHPRLRPIRMNDSFMDSYSRIQKAQWVDFARKLEAHIRAGGAPVAELLRGA